jgi:hypothetical protein
MRNHAGVPDEELINLMRSRCMPTTTGRVIEKAGCLIEAHVHLEIFFHWTKSTIGEYSGPGPQVKAARK